MTRNERDVKMGLAQAQYTEADLNALQLQFQRALLSGPTRSRFDGVRADRRKDLEEADLAARLRAALILAIDSVLEAHAA